MGFALRRSGPRAVPAASLAERSISSRACARDRSTLPRVVGSRVRLSPEDKASLLEYWRYYEPIAGEIGDSLRKSLAALPEWAPLVHALTPSQIAEQDRRNLELQRRAIVDGD